LVDADPVGAARLVAVSSDGECHWPNVRFFPQLPASRLELAAYDVVVIDAPPLVEERAVSALYLADGVILTTLADPLSVRTLPRALAVLWQVHRLNPRIRLHGLIVERFDENDPLQQRMLDLLRKTRGDVLLEPPIPYQVELRDWVLGKGCGLPEGPAQEAYRSVVGSLEAILANVAAV
jgi:cellulose biosynthesis protein BcsQ